MSTTLAVIGNGAAGALVVTSALREAARRGAALDVEWIGDGDPGRGVAYATPHRWHRLNVPAAGMSLGEAELSFPAWLTRHGQDDDPFASRHAFGTYLVETLEIARAAAGPRVALTEHRDRATHAASDGDGLRFGLRSGASVHADAAVLALGPFPSSPVPGAAADVATHPRVIADPWDGRVEAISGSPTVLLLGTGLTMVDVALTVGRVAPQAHIVAVSRTGMVPRDHEPDEGEPAEPAVRPGRGLGIDGLVAGIERAVVEHGGRWREVVDGLRPVTPELWRSLDRQDQHRFLAEQARRWETHRHRTAPSVAGEFAALHDDGRLRLLDGGVETVEVVDGSRLRVTLGADDTQLTVDWLVSCTGAQDDVTRVDDPLVRSLLDAGLARAHPLGLGFDTGEHGSLSSSKRLHGIGTLRRGELYETTAIPEIRDQAADLARHLLADDPLRSHRRGQEPAL